MMEINISNTVPPKPPSNFEVVAIMLLIIALVCGLWYACTHPRF